MKIKDLLSGMRFQMPQNVANMAVLPIVSDREIDELSSEMVFQIVKDTDYSRLTLENVGDKPVIVPQGTKFVTGSKGQDRTVLSSTVIKPQEKKEMNVGCIQPSETSHIKLGKMEFSFIPARLRVPAILGQESGSCSVLWKDIEKYLKDIGIRGNTMEQFYKSFDKELKEFVAQFEPVEKQLGAVIMINNEVAGIEVYPNYGSWRKIWRLLIRDSYGADALTLIKANKIMCYKPVIDSDKVSTTKDIISQVLGIKANFVSFMNQKIEPFLEQEVEMTEKEVSSGFKVYNLRSPNLLGQAIIRTEGNKIVYISLLRADDVPHVQPEHEDDEDDDDY